MPSPTSQDGSGTEEETPESSGSPTSEAVVETTECPNCGRTFVGDYCPDCGQEANPSTSVTDVIGGFFRELVDIERGIWPTFVGLTLRPGQTLRQYLEGTRKGLARPGRYLMGAVVVAFGTDRLLRWLLKTPDTSTPWPPGSPSQWNWDWSEKGLQGALYLVEYWLQQATGGELVLVYLLAPLALALILHRLFSEDFESGGEALGVSSFLVGQMALFHAGLVLAYELVGHDLHDALFHVGSVDPGLSVIPGRYSWICAVYLGIALYQCFRRDWKNFITGLAVWLWTHTAVVIINPLGRSAAALGLVFANPEVYGDFPAIGVNLYGSVLAVKGVGIVLHPNLWILSFILLVHITLEVYYRYW